MALTPKQQRFVSEYLIDLNGKQAAVRAGYSPKSAEFQASKLLADSKVSQEVAKGKAEQLQTAGLSATRTLEEMRRLAFSDVRKLFDADGNLKPLHLLDDDAAASIASLEVVKKNLAAGDGVTDTVHKIKTWDKTRNLEMLAKHFGLLEEKVAHSGHLTIGFDGSWQPPVRD
jgi:phage terminase small subunit